MLNWGNARVSPDGIGPRHIPMVSKEARKAHFRVIMSLTVAVVHGEVALVDFTLRVDLVLMLGV